MEDPHFLHRKILFFITERSQATSDIEPTKMRNDSFRYQSWMIQSASLKKRVVHRYTKFYISTFTEESWGIIERFVYHAVDVFNTSHPLQITTVEKTPQTLEDWWDYDREEHVREHAIMKGVHLE